LLKLLKSNEQQIVELIQKYAKINKDMWDVEVHKRFVVVTPKQPDHYPLVCSHYDTVRHTPLSGYNIKEDIVTSVEGALGGDDRCGVAIALSLMQAGIPANYAFFDEEECGADGSGDFLIETPWIAKESSCYIGLDRRGHEDAAVDEIRMNGDGCLYFDNEICDCYCKNKWECFSAQEISELKLLSIWNEIGGAK